jgi:NADPH2:quinone reductase
MLAFGRMQAILVREFGPPSVMKIETLPDPKPGATEVLVRIRAVGVNPVETYMRSGTYARKPALPYIPGSDAAGDVEAVGTDVSTVKPGDRVYVYGTIGGNIGVYAERVVCGASQVHPLPANASYAQGAAIGVPYATAYRALFQRAAARPGETVLVHGATGGVGLAAVQMCRAYGLRALGTGGTARGLEAAAAQGASAVFNHRVAGYLDEILKATGGRGVDVILEMAAHLNLDKDLGLLAPHGRVVVIGNRGRVEIDARQTMGRDAAILGMLLFNTGEADLASIHAALVAGLANGSLAPVIGQEMPLAEAPRAHEALMQDGALGKIVLTL